MATEFNGRPLVDLEKLFLDDPLEILRFIQELEANGWCFVRLSQNARLFATQLNHIRESLSAFFTGSQSEKSRYLSPNAFGYTRVNHKEGIKLLSDQQGEITSQNPLPKNLNATLQHLSQLMSDLTSRIKPIIINAAGADRRATKRADISEQCMLDIAHYFNTNRGPTSVPEVGHDTSEVNCVPHYDPGLFSLSILSTCEGLQLKDQRTNQWIDGPNNSQVDQSNIGAIWLGEAASILTENRFKAGIHRVIYPRMPHQARLTVWQEVCTTSQIQQLFHQQIQMQTLPHDAQVTLANQPGSKPMVVRPDGETRHAFMRRMEGERGISASKSSRSHFRVSSPPVSQTNNNIPPPQMQQQQQQPNYVPSVQKRAYRVSSNRNMNSNNAQ